MTLDPISKRLLAGAGQNGLISLMYHSITPGNSRPKWQWALSLKQFREQLDLLQEQGWTTISPHALLDSRPLPDKSVLITFDDGYADNYLAFNELAKRNMVATWFIVTQDVGNTSSWRDINAPQLPMLSATQLQEMHSQGMIVGSHTHTHCRLPQVSIDQANYELRVSRERLSMILGQAIDCFAYPYGLYTAPIASLLNTHGYRLAFTTRSGFGLVDHDVFQIRRLSIMASDSLSCFARKLAFGANDVSWRDMALYFSARLKDRISS